MKTYAIIGNSAAGVWAAKSIRGLDCVGKISMFATDSSFYSRCQLHKAAVGLKSEESISFLPNNFIRNLNIDLHFSCKIEQINARDKKLIDQNGKEHPFDELLVATGATAILPRISGLEGPGVFALRSMHDALAIRNSLQNSRQVAVIGSGLVGCELAAELASIGVAVTLIECMEQVLPCQLDKEMGAVAKSLLERNGVKVICGEKIVELRRNGQGLPSKLVLETGKQIDCDLVIGATGVKPDIKLLQECGAQVREGVVVDARCQTSLHSIYAAGDVTEWRNEAGRWMQAGIWPTAARQGLVAGTNMAGGNKQIEKEAKSRTSFNLMGTKFVSLGEVCASNDSCKKLVYKSVNALGQPSVKIFYVTDENLIGAILWGDISQAGLYYDAIVNRRGINNFHLSAMDVATFGSAERNI
jgi:NAD(P)H-nitrite reductase large subunit